MLSVLAAWVVARAGRAEQLGVAEAALAQEAAAARARAKLGQEAAAARAQETRAVAVAEAAVAVVKAMEAEAEVAQEPLGLVAAVGRAQAAPAAEAEAVRRRGWLLSLRGGQHGQNEQHIAASVRLKKDRQTSSGRAR